MSKSWKKAMTYVFTESVQDFPPNKTFFCNKIKCLGTDSRETEICMFSSLYFKTKTPVQTFVLQEIIIRIILITNHPLNSIVNTPTVRFASKKKEKESEKAQGYFSLFCFSATYYGGNKIWWCSSLGSVAFIIIITEFSVTWDSLRRANLQAAAWICNYSSAKPR